MLLNRTAWQQLAEERALEAQALLAAGRWSGAYYLIGYAVEFGLKSCVLVRLAREPEVIFDEKRFSEKCWTHVLKDLLGLAGLTAAAAATFAANRAFEKNWEACLEWSEADRFNLKTEAEARNIVVAVTDNANGVLQWVKGHW